MKRASLTARQKFIRKKYTKLRRSFTNPKKHNVVLVIDHQGFDLKTECSRVHGAWLRDMLAIALSRISSPT